MGGGMGAESTSGKRRVTTIRSWLPPHSAYPDSDTHPEALGSDAEITVKTVACQNAGQAVDPGARQTRFP